MCSMFFIMMYYTVNIILAAGTDTDTITANLTERMTKIVNINEASGFHKKNLPKTVYA